MPNHFHLLMSQEEDDGVSEFMRALSNAYTRYFNQQYERVGCLFQGRYKAAWIDKQNYYLHISRYIHLNPQDIGQKPTEYDYSSLLYYLDNGPERPSWLDVETIRDAIGSANDYRAFIAEDQEPDDLQELKIDN